MTLTELNQLDKEMAANHFRQCCVSEAWIAGMLDAMPFDSSQALYTAADRVWLGLAPSDFKQAFEGHPKIGDVSSLRAKYANTKALAEGEQSSVKQADEDTLHALAAGNTAYEQRFGYIFIVCATGKSAQEMLSLLKARLNNDPEFEINIAAAEQQKITRLRLEKLLQPNEAA